MAENLFQPELIQRCRVLAKFLLALVASVSLGVIAVRPAAAPAPKRECADKLIHDWYVDGQIQGAYPVLCYRAALSDLPDHEIVYSKLRSDLSHALVWLIRENGGAVRPNTAVPAPANRFALSPSAKSRKSHSVHLLAAMAFLLVVLLVWCVVRWRSRRQFR